MTGRIADVAARLFPDGRFDAARAVAAMMGIALLLALAMAFASAINRDPAQWRGPPDEPGHRSAARYYMDHWLPPKAGDPATLDSYSKDYGYSYLNEFDPVYLLAGKFAALASPVVGDADRAMRLFNVSLLALLALACLRRPAAWPVFVPLVLSPQVWYIFSYFNGDALPLCLSVLIACQLAHPASAFNRFLDDPRLAGGIGGALAMAALVALLLLSKRNYYAFLAILPALLAARRFGLPATLLLALAAVGGAATYLKWVVVPEDVRLAAAAACALAVVLAGFAPRATRRERARFAAKFAMLAVVAATLVLPRLAWDRLSDETPEQRQATLGTLQESHAKPGYKPSEIFSTQPKPGVVFHGIDMRARGVPLEALFQPPWNWHVRTFSSSTGQYGWLDILAPLPYYLAIAAGYVLILAAYVQALVRSRSAFAWATFALVAAFSMLAVAVSLHHSWNNDFQAQGRYLFPIVAMLGAGFMAVKERIATRFFALAVGACFLLSTWSFAWVGLRQIPKAF